MALDVRPGTYGRDEVAHDLTTRHSHPRARGFQVLSRIARNHASDDEYSPRHRSDVAVNGELRIVTA
jgi:hypothetical protein